LQQAAEQLNQWPSNLSRIERGIARNRVACEKVKYPTLAVTVT